jgi:serine/threonine-protein kinase
MLKAHSMRTSCPACNSRFDEELVYCPKDGTQVVPDENAQTTQDMIGQVLDDRYKIVRKLGEGGMGEVYEARHVFIEKRVAIKLLRHEIVSNHEAVTRFHQEARSASSIGHENIIAIEDFGRLPDGRAYLAMEFLEGEPLDALIEDDKPPMPMPRALEIMTQVCRGLAAAHAKGIIHRDMKPENVWITPNPRMPGHDLVKILDFGIAKVSGNDGAAEHLTRTGAIFGTPFYMSPEQALGRGLDHRSDIYSVGVILYQLFTGKVPFKAETFMGILTQHITTMPTPPRQLAPDRQIPPEVEAIILKAMAKEPATRQQSMVDLLGDLQRVQVHLGIANTPLPVGVTSVPGLPMVPGSYPPPGAVISGGYAAMPPTGAFAVMPGGPSGAFAVPPPNPTGAFVATPGPATSGWPAMGAQLDEPAPRGHKGLILGLVLGVAVAGAGAAFVVLHKGQTPAPQQVAAPPPGPVAADVDYTVGSEPDGADVLEDGVVIGQAPATVTLDQGVTKVITLRLQGYQDQQVLLDPSKEHRIVVTMVPLPGTTPPPKPNTNTAQANNTNPAGNGSTTNNGNAQPQQQAQQQTQPQQTQQQQTQTPPQQTQQGQAQQGQTQAQPQQGQQQQAQQQTTQQQVSTNNTVNTNTNPNPNPNPNDNNTQTGRTPPNNGNQTQSNDPFGRVQDSTDGTTLHPF